MTKTAIRMTQETYEKYKNKLLGIQEAPAETSTPGATTPGINWDEHGFAGQNWTSSKQPRWKWSFDGKDLMIWPVDPVQGRPHHIELTGMQFYNLAQGRVYVDADGNLEILVWEDRATPELQDQAVEAVDNWLQAKVGRPSDAVYFQSEGGYYPTIDPDKGPDLDKLMTAYMGYPVKATQNPNGNLSLSRVPEQAQQLDDQWRERVDAEASVA